MTTITIPPNTKQILLQNKPESRTITLKKDSHLEYIMSFKNSHPEEKSIVTFELDEENAHVEIFGLFTGKDSDSIKFETRTIHKADNTYGHTTVRTMLKDGAVSDYFGLIRIEKNTKGTDGHLSHDAMLLSKQAKSKSVPSLEIEANDVKAGHSASVGQVDEEAVFYLRSRGLSENQARELMIEGFFEELLGKISDENTAQRVRTQLHQSLN
jgi:Fe-S cluster assembly protein SufD